MRVISMLVLAIIGLAMIGAISSASYVDSTVNMDADGLIHTSLSADGSECGNIYALTSSSFGRADVRYTSTVSDMVMNTELYSNSGVIGMSSGMYNFVWNDEHESCENGACTVTPARSTTTFGLSNVLLDGYGSVVTNTHPDTFDVYASGNGSFERTVGVIDINGNVNDESTTCNMLNEFRYRESTRVSGRFNVASTFTYTR